MEAPCLISFASFRAFALTRQMMPCTVHLKAKTQAEPEKRAAGRRFATCPPLLITCFQQSGCIGLAITETCSGAEMGIATMPTTIKTEGRH